MPLAVKDLFDTAGVRTTYGSAVFAEHVPCDDRGSGAAARGGGLRERRQDEPARVRLRRRVAGTRTTAWCQNPTAPGRTSGGSSGGTAAAIRPGSWRWGWEPTRAARSASRRRAAGSPGSSRPTGSSRSTASLRSRRASTTSGRWRARWVDCVELMVGARPGIRGRAARGVPLALAWVEHADPLVRARVEAAASARYAAPASSSSPSPSRRPPRSCARSRASTASSSRSTASCTARACTPSRALPRRE